MIKVTIEIYLFYYFNGIYLILLIIYIFNANITLIIFENFNN